MLIFIAIITIILLLIHWVIYSAFISIFSITSLGWIITWKVIFILLAVAFVGATLLSYNFDGTLVRFLYTASAVWLGTMFYLFIASFVYGAIVGITKIFWNGSIGSGSVTSTILAWSGMAMFALAIVMSVYAVVHARKLVVKEISVAIPNLPAEWSHKKAVWVSDIHLGRIYNSTRLSQIVEMVNTESPDMVFIGGDLYDGVKVDEDAIISPLRDIRAPLGTFFITGNHEEFGDSSRFTSAIQRAGIRFLNNEKIELEGVQIIGVDDRDSKSKEIFTGILSRLNIDEDHPAILLKHQPSELDMAEKAGIDLQLSGHTHRSQVVPLNIFSYLLYKGYDYGLKDFGAMKIYTSSGAGTWGPPMRLGSDSEIVVVRFR